MVKGSKKMVKGSKKNWWREVKKCWREVKKNTEGKVTPQDHRKEFVKIDHPLLSMHIQFVFLSLFL